jgi:hypothetical protein
MIAVFVFVCVFVNTGAHLSERERDAEEARAASLCVCVCVCVCACVRALLLLLLLLLRGLVAVGCSAAADKSHTLGPHLGGWIRHHHPIHACARPPTHTPDRPHTHQVNQLRPAERRYVDHIKGACETKRKTYRSLVWTANVPRSKSYEIMIANSTCGPPAPPKHSLRAPPLSGFPLPSPPVCTASPSPPTAPPPHPSLYVCVSGGLMII